MHYHVWVQINLHTMNRDPRRYQTRSAAYKHIRRHLAGQGAMVLRCDRNLGLSPGQRELVYKQALRVAEDIVIRRGSWGVARATLAAAAASLTDQVAELAVDGERRDSGSANEWRQW